MLFVTLLRGAGNSLWRSSGMIRALKKLETWKGFFFNFYGYRVVIEVEEASVDF